MHERGPNNEYKNQEKTWGEILRGIPFVVRLVIFTILIGLSLVSYNVGKAVNEAKTNSEMNNSVSEKERYSDSDWFEARRKNGDWSFSSDGGKTWSKDEPEEDEGKVKTVLTKKSKDGKTLYSTDGGKTWSEEKPEGFEMPDVDEILDSITEDIFPSEENEDLGSGQST